MAVRVSSFSLLRENHENINILQNTIASNVDVEAKTDIFMD